MRVQRLYRLTIDSWPTPNGLPFDRQDDEFWGQITDAYYNPSDGNPWPEWLGDISDWLDDPGDSWSPPHRAFVRGRYYEDAGLVVPVMGRRHWQTRAAAQRKADEFQRWGCVVRVDESDPIAWGDHA